MAQYDKNNFNFSDDKNYCDNNNNNNSDLKFIITT
jgi:hypothetical protein